MKWEVDFHPECEAWVRQLTPVDEESLLSAVRVLQRVGPGLGRPLVDRVNASRHHNMKELRPPSSGSSELRVLFAFDPQRRAILLVGGDKASDWDGWYPPNIAVADARYEEHLATLGAPPSKSRKRRKQRGGNR